VKTHRKQNLKIPLPALKKYINRIICGDSLKVLKTIPSESIDCVITSPPYWALRDYNVQGQIGLEPTIEEYLNKLTFIFDEVKRVLKPSGTCWINFGDTYAYPTKGGHQNKPQGNLYDSLSKRASIPKLKPKLSIPNKSLCLIPTRFAVRMIERGWILRNEIIWHKPNAMPERARDRFPVDFEKVFFFVKERRYFFSRQYEPVKNPQELKRKFASPFDHHKYRQRQRSASDPEAIKRNQWKILQKGRAKRSVWSIGTGNSLGNHFAVFPPKLVETPILAGSPENGIVLDPFMGSGTTGLVARKLNRNFIGIELNPEYVELARKRIKNMK
jgi:DNA modification methylase